MKKVILGLVVLVASQSWASGLDELREAQTRPVGFIGGKSVWGSFAQTFPEAVADAAFIDLPISTFMWSLGSGSPGSIALGTGTAVVGYSIRKTCNKYGFNGTNSVWCGILGGGLKYSGKAAINGEYTFAESIIGAVDGGTYEGTAAYRGVFPTLEWMAIEAGVNAVGYWLRPKDEATDLVKELKSGAAVGVLISAFVNTCHAWYAADLQAAVKTWMSGSDENGDL